MTPAPCPICESAGGFHLKTCGSEQLAKHVKSRSNLDPLRKENK